MRYFRGGYYVGKQRGRFLFRVLKYTILGSDSQLFSYANRTFTQQSNVALRFPPASLSGQGWI